MAAPLRVIGRVVSTNPARRELRVECPEIAMEPVLKASWAWVHKGPAPLRCKIERTKAAGGTVILTLASGLPKDTVATFRHAEVSVEAALFSERPETEWTPEDLPGMSLRQESGQVFGRIAEVMTAPGNVVLVVETPERGRMLLPAAPGLILSVRRQNAEVVVGDIAPYAMWEDEEEAPE